MSIASIKRELRNLPYTEMKAFGDQIVATLRERAKPGIGIVGVDPDKLCDILATLPAPTPDQLKTEDVYLAQAYTKKRGGRCEIIVKPSTGGGWDVKSGDFVHFAPTVRGAISELLDQIAAYEALLSGEGRAR